MAFDPSLLLARGQASLAIAMFDDILHESLILSALLR
jgi:hypothetical protein